MLVTCLGLIVVDLIASGIPNVAEPGKLVLVESGIKVKIGGHCANVSIDLRKLGVKRRGVSAIGAVGIDMLGDFAEKELARFGIVSHVQRVLEAETSKNMILVVRGEDRRFHFDPGANLHVDFDEAGRVIFKESPEWLYVGLIGLNEEIDLKIIKLLKRVRRMGVKTILDTIMPPTGGDVLIKRFKGLVDILHCNGLEAQALTGESHAEEAVKRLLRGGITLPVVTLGGGGLIAGFRELLIQMPVFQVRVVDPTGAGDAFCAGLLKSLLAGGGAFDELDGWMLSRHLLYASASGAACVSGVGTTTTVTKENVNGILADQGEKILTATSIKKV
ncbi:MAG: carbohydrate kinase family protein [Candidatus Bathyarchaeia archaeon]